MARAGATRRPAWLNALIALHGQTDVDPRSDRWLWHDGEMGVVVSHRTHVWEVLAFGSERSVTLRSVGQPSDVDVGMAVDLAGLYDVPGAVAT